MDLLKLTEIEKKSDIERFFYVNINEIKKLSPLGLKFINYYTLTERLNTVAQKKLSFMDFIQNKNNCMETDCFFRYITNPKINKSLIKKQYDYFKFTHGSVSVFRPVIASKLFNTYQPKIILDPFMGWGSRMLGAGKSNAKKYIGFDSNINMENAYNEIKNTLANYSKLEIEINIKNIMDVDFSKYSYDFVFSSPPYYNKETYSHQPVKYKTEKEWDKLFYIPLFTNIYKCLEPRGYFCLNINHKLYVNVCVPLLGECDELFSMPLKQNKMRQNTYNEYIYIWRKC